MAAITFSLPLQLAPEPGQYDCRLFDLTAHREDLAAQRADAFSSIQGVAFIPHAETSTQGAGDHVRSTLLACVYSIGLVRLYNLHSAIGDYVGSRRLASPILSWHAHEGGSTCCAIAVHKGESVLVTGGADGYVRVWPVAQLLPAACDPIAATVVGPRGRVTALQPAMSVALNTADGAGAWSGTGQASFAVTCLAVDPTGRVYAGSSDGGVHCISLDDQASLVCGRHLAAVLDMDIAPAAGLLASGGEDGTVRVWDVRTRTPGLVLFPTHGDVGSAGVTFPANAPRAALLQHVRSSPAVTCVRFSSPAGGWLLTGTADPKPCLTTWSLDAKLVAARTTLPVSPQVLAVLPGEVLVAGAGPCLYRYTFTGELSSTHTLAPQLGSVLALDVLRPQGTAGFGPGGETELAPGSVALGGTYGALDVFSRHSARVTTSHLLTSEEVDTCAVE